MPLDQQQWEHSSGVVCSHGITIFQSIAYYQCGDIAIVWIDRDVDVNLLGFRVPVAWFNSIDSLGPSLLCRSLCLVRHQRHAAGTREVAKMGSALGLPALQTCSSWPPAR